MKHIIILILTFISLSGIAQNPLKKEIIGNNQTEKMVNSAYTFKNANGKSVLMRTLVDNRSANWNKQINDSTRIDLIKDFWKRSYIEIVNQKIESDLTKNNIKISTAQMPDDYVITPTIDIHFPNFVVYPKMGYWILTKINIEVSKNGVNLFTKGYMDNFFFTDGVSGYDKAYDKDHLNGTDAGMWIGMQHVLDKFYKDLDLAFAGQKVESSDIPLEVSSIESNIYNDESLVGTNTPYSTADKSKVEKTNLQENNYKVEETAAITPPVDPTLETGLAALGIDKKKEEEMAAQKKKEEELAAKKKIEAEAAQAKQKEEAQKAAQAKMEEKRVQDSLSKIEQAMQEKMKTDSLKSISGEIAKQRAIDSITKVKEEEAKKKKEEELARKQKAEELAKAQAAIKDSIQKVNQLAQAVKIEEKRIADSLKKIEVNKKLELAQKKKEEEKQKLAQKQSKQVAQKTQSQFKNAPAKSDDISSIIKELAREVEAEDRQGVYTTSKESASTAAQRRAEINTEQKAKLDSLKVLREQERAAKAAELAKLQEEQKAKELEKIKAEKLANYVKDSIEYAQKLIKRNEAIAKAQELAKKQDEADLIKNPNAAYAYAAASTDPPSKMPDKRTPEQRKQDRVFKPKNVISEQLLSQVKMVSPVEEAKLMAQFGQNNEVAVDSVLIAEQMSREVKSINELKAIEKTAQEKKELLEKKLKEMKKPKGKGKKDAKTDKDAPKSDDADTTKGETNSDEPATKDEAKEDESADSKKEKKADASELINEAVDEASDKPKTGTIVEEVKGKTIEKTVKEEPAPKEEDNIEDLIKETVVEPDPNSIEGKSKTTDAVRDIEKDIDTKKEEISKKIKEITGE